MTDTDTNAGTDAGEGPDFGTLTVPAGAGEIGAARTKFRIAILGDFTGRASRGELETGAGLAKRRPIKLDVDTVDDVIEGFRTTLTLPIGPEGTDVSVELTEMDDLHPDELYDKVELFAELQTLRRQLTGGRAEKAMADLQSWGEEFGALKAQARRRARGTEVPADMRLSDFASLIGAKPEAGPPPSPADELIRRVVAPFVVKARDPAVDGMVQAVDEALSQSMRALLHHPDFQAVESTWRSIDMLARRIETGDGLELVLYDVAAEELAVDLAAADDMAETGIFGMLAEKPALDENQGPLAAVIGLYQFEETPPHAELLGRMARIAAYMDAPFVAAISPKFLDTKPEDLHPLVRKAWDQLRALPEAAFVGLATPRFLLRHPYGQRTDPISVFDFEEFTRREGLKGMLWANPAVLVALLLGASWRQGNGKVELGKVMTLDDVPFHYYTDEHGDQVALPCTQRLLTEKAVAATAVRSFMPVLSIQGRNEIRLGSFRSLAGAQLAGPWSSGGLGGPAAMKSRQDAANAAVAAASAQLAVDPAGSAAAAGAPAAEEEEDDLDALLSSLEQDAEDDTGKADDESDLDALLASMEPQPEDEPAPADDDLDALLASLEDEQGAAADAAEEPPAPGAGDAADDGDDELAALLAEFGDDDSESAGEEPDMDEDLEALLRDL